MLIIKTKEGYMVTKDSRIVVRVTRLDIKRFAELKKKYKDKLEKKLKDL